jgi:hypothetical protein
MYAKGNQFPLSKTRACVPKIIKIPCLSHTGYHAAGRFASLYIAHNGRVVCYVKPVIPTEAKRTEESP